jgi:hypothetical protein
MIDVADLVGVVFSGLSALIMDDVGNAGDRHHDPVARLASFVVYAALFCLFAWARFTTSDVTSLGAVFRVLRCVLSGEYHPKVHKEFAGTTQLRPVGGHACW